MAKLRIDDIKVGRPDQTGLVIDTVYVSADTYAIYRNGKRVMVQFDDVEDNAKAQRQGIAQLAGLRADVNGLIDGWRSDPRQQGRVDRFDRKVAAEIELAFDTSVADAKDGLAEIKDELAAERLWRARAWYLLYAASAAIFGIVTAWLATSLHLGSASSIPDAQRPLWLAAATGAVGALFSIGQGIGSRDVGLDLSSLENIVEAIARVFVGMISATVLVQLASLNLVHLSLGGADLFCSVGDKTTSSTACAPADGVVMVLAFAAGFVERMVINLLNTAVVAFGTSGSPKTKPPSTPPPTGAANADLPSRSGTAPTGGGAASAQRGVQGGGSSASSGNGASAGSDANDAGDQGDCTADAPACGSEIARDQDLPPATGGIAAPAGA